MLKRTRIDSLYLPILLLIVWEMGIHLGWLNSHVISGPYEEIRNLPSLLGDRDLTHGFLVSLLRLTVGFCIGCGAAVALGIGVGLSQRLQRAFEPTIRTLSPVPPIVWIPFLVGLLDLGEPMQIGLLSLGSFFVCFVHTVRGIRSTDQHLLDVGVLFGKRRSELLIKIMLPSASAEIVFGMRLAFSYSLILLTVAESVGVSGGLGWLIMDARTFSRPHELVAAACLLGSIGVCVDLCLRALQSRFSSWSRAFAGF